MDGGWGPWIEIPCTVNPTRCGIGVFIRARDCSNPAPKNGGKPCEGESVIMKPCGTPCGGKCMLFKYCDSDLSTHQLWALILGYQ